MRKILTAIIMLSLGTAYAGNYTYQQNGAISFGWQTSDEFALFSVSGSIMELTVKSINSSDRHYAITEQVGWAFASNATYFGCYPYAVNYLLYHFPYTALPITYNHQTQATNASTEHLAAVDYMTAQTKSTSSALSINYKHLGAILRIAAYVPETKTFSSLKLTTKDNTTWFAEEATVNATDNTMSVTATAAVATLTLSNITVEGGDSLIAYIMTAPTDLTDKSMLLTLQATDGSTLQTYIAGNDIQAGKVYPVSVGRENYFRIQNDNSGAGEDTPEVLSLPIEIENNVTSDDQILTATAYAPDFTIDTENEMTPFLLGDVNLDGTVDVTDVVIVVNHFQNDTTDELDMNVADIDGDGVIDVTDVVGIVNIYQRK